MTMVRSTYFANDSTATATAVSTATTTCRTSNSTIRKTRFMKSIPVLTVWIGAAVSSSLSLAIVVESRRITTTASSSAAGGSSGEPYVSKMTQHQRQRWRNRPSVVIGDPAAEDDTTTTATTTTAAITVTHVPEEDEDGFEEELDDPEEGIIFENDGGWLGDLNQVLHTNQMNIMEYAGGGGGGRGRGGVSPYGLAVDRHDVTMTYKQLEMAMSMPATVRPFLICLLVSLLPFYVCLLACLLKCWNISMAFFRS